MTIVHITYHDETNIGSCPIGQTGGFENADGNGEIHCFRIFDGVSVMLMQLEMGSYTEIRTQVGVLEVNFCINGRFETSFSMRSHVLLKPGDMAISCYDGLHGTKSESHFPLGYYEGLCLEIDPAAAGHWIRLNAPAFPIDFTALKQNLLGSKWYMVGPAGPRCEHVFRELYESASYAERGFLQLKVLELMLLLGRIPQERAADPYCSAEQTALAHHPGSSADEPGGICVPCPAGGRARDFRVAPAKAVQADLWYACLPLHQGIPSGASSGGAGSQQEAYYRDRPARRI